MPDRPNSTQQSVEKLERYEHVIDGEKVRVLESKEGNWVRLSDVLNALQDVEGEGDNEQVARVFRDLREDDEALRRISRAINRATIDGGTFPRARAAVDAIFAYLVAAPVQQVDHHASCVCPDCTQPPGEGDGGQVEGRVFGELAFKLMEERPIVAALDVFTFDGRGYPVELADKMRDAISAALKEARAVLSQPQAGEEEGENQTQTDYERAIEGLPADLVTALNDRSIFVEKDAAVFRMIAEYRDAPSNTVSADPRYISPESNEEQGK